MSQGTVGQIMNMIGRNHRDMAPDIGDVAEWCYEAIREVGTQESFVRVNGLAIDVVNGRATMPCNMARLLSVSENCDGCGGVQYSQYASGIHVYSGQTSVRIDALLYPTDDDGYPLIDAGMEQACYQYCLTKLLLDPWINGKLPDSKYSEVKRQWHEEKAKAKASMYGVSRDDLRQVTRTVRAMFVGPRFRGLD